MRDFFQSDLITILRMKKIHMGNFDDYEFFGGIHHCFRDTQCSCYASASASIYVPWSTTNAAAIMSSIDTLSKCFAIYPLSGRNMKHSILLDVTIKAQENYQNDFFELSSTKLKEIQSEISHYDKSIQCPSEVTDLLHMLNLKYGLENIKYVCLKVLGCHHKSFANSQYLEGFGMTVGGLFFPCFEKHDDCGTAESSSHNNNFDEQCFASKKFINDDTSEASGLESVEIVNVTKRGIAMNVQHILKVIVVHRIALILWMKEKYYLSVSLVIWMEVQVIMSGPLHKYSFLCQRMTMLNL